MLSLSNILSFSRIPLAFLFFQQNPSLRILAVVLAMITDSIDGYFARRSKSASRLGVYLDPITDKFFVYLGLFILFFEAKLSSWQVLALASRDCGSIVYLVTLYFSGRWRTSEFNSFFWGKVATSVQFIILIGVLAGIDFSWTTYAFSASLGVLSFLELYRRPGITNLKTD